jgi:hypothetical protein
MKELIQKRNKANLIKLRYCEILILQIQVNGSSRMNGGERLLKCIMYAKIEGIKTQKIGKSMPKKVQKDIEQIV